MRKPLLTAVVFIFVLSLALAQSEGEAEKPMLRKPEWKVGDWWKVKILALDRKAEILGIPRPPDEEPRYYETNTFLLKVAEMVTEEREENGEKVLRELFKVSFSVAETKNEQGFEFYANLYYDADTLAFVRFEEVEKGDVVSRYEFEGAVVFDPMIDTYVGFPFSWPDFSNTDTSKPPSEIEVPEKPAVRQEVRTTDDGTLRVILSAAGEEEGKGIEQVWNPEQSLWWTHCDRGDMKAELVDFAPKEEEEGE